MNIVLYKCYFYLLFSQFKIVSRYFLMGWLSLWATLTTKPSIVNDSIWKLISVWKALRCLFKSNLHLNGIGFLQIAQYASVIWRCFLMWFPIPFAVVENPQTPQWHCLSAEILWSRLRWFKHCLSLLKVEVQFFHLHRTMFLEVSWLSDMEVLVPVSSYILKILFLHILSWTQIFQICSKQNRKVYRITELWSKMVEILNFVECWKVIVTKSRFWHIFHLVIGKRQDSEI